MNIEKVSTSDQPEVRWLPWGFSLLQIT